MREDRSDQYSETSAKGKKPAQKQMRVTVRMPVILVGALERSAHNRGVTLEAEAQIAIEEHLKRAGITFWQG